MPYIYSYNAHSNSARMLAQALGVKRIKHSRSRFRGDENKVVINWGSSNLPDEVEKCFLINDPHKVGLVANKLTFFESVAECIEVMVPFSTSQLRVNQWLSEGHTVVARKKLTGHSGEGIELIEGRDSPIPNAPLYTLYKKKKDEYRVHCFQTEEGGVNIFDIQRKARDPNNDSPNWKVRNHANGFVFVRGDVDPPACVLDAARKVFHATGLDFGAIDIIYNEHEDKAYVLEINSAPGLTGTTLDKYVQMFREEFL